MPAADDTTPEGVGGALALLDTLFSCAPVGLAFVDAEFRYVRINAYLAAMNGVAPEDHVGRTVAEVVPELAPTVEPLFRRVMETGEPILNVEVGGETPAAPGVKRYWLTNYYPVRPAEGAPVGVGVVVTEVTEQRVAEERLLRAQRAARLGTWDWDLLTGEVVWSDGVYELLGLAPGSVDPSLDRWLEFVLPEDVEPTRREIQQIIAGGGEFSVEFRVRGADGAVRWLAAIGRVEADEGGASRRLLGVNVDVTERKREELDRQFLLELGDRIRLGGVGAGALLEEVTRATSGHLGAARCLFIEIDEAGNRGVIRHEYRRAGLPAVPGEYRISDYSPETLEEIRGGHVVVNHDAEHDPRTAAIFSTTYEPDGERSYVSIPLFTGGRWRAIFWVSDDRPRRWTPQEVSLMEAVAERAWLAAEKLRGEAESDRQRRLYDTILSSTPDLVYVFDLGHRFTYANDVLLRMWGRSWDEAIGKNCLELGYPDWHAAMHDRELEEVKATKQPVRGVVPFSGTFGRRLYDYIFVPIIGADGEVEAIAGTTRDVTEIKEAEESLLRSRETLSLAMGAGRMGAWSLDLATDAVYWSPELEAIFGLAPGTFGGTLDAFYEYVHEEDRGRVAAEVGGAVAEGRGYVVEFRHRHADGGERWMEGRGRAVNSAGGGPANVFGIGIDITDRKRAELNAGFLAEVVGDSAQATTPEEIVRAVGERLNGFLGVSTCAFVEIDEAAETATINYEWHGEGAPSLTGAYELSEFVTPEFLRGAMAGETLVIRDVGTDARIPDPASWSALKIGAHVNVPLVRKGEWRFSLCVYHAVPYDWRGDEVKLMEELAARVWSRLERAFAERERERLLEWESSARLRAEEANRLKDEFLATVSHELRTPLTAIAGWAHLLETGNLDREMSRHAVAVIRRNCEQQRQIVEDVLDVSRFISGKLKLERERVDLTEVVLAALETVRPAAEARNILLRSELKPGVEVWGDPVRLQQVVWNLLTNAVKFTPPGGRVSVSAGRLLTHARVEVSDTGQGIAAEFLPHVFDRFRQADGSTTRRHGGLGLGLSIVRHLVETHGGSVHAYSAGEGQGATFTVDLPLPAVTREEGADPRGEGEGRREAPAETPSSATARADKESLPPLVGVRVLLVDDEADTLEMVSLLLRTGGALVTAVRSAAEALDSLGRAAPDVIVADVGMPEVDGYELMRRVRALSPDNGGQTPALALTAYATAAEQAHALRSGFQKHLAKPAEPGSLYAAVADLAGRSVRRET
ncbi:MAG: PAS domain-containing protein [Acidobacteria bacterium]|nr:PAS domain-containing protein [Acidobacteriota bacterium]